MYAANSSSKTLCIYLQWSEKPQIKARYCSFERNTNLSKENRINDQKGSNPKRLVIKLKTNFPGHTVRKAKLCIYSILQQRPKLRHDTISHIHYDTGYLSDIRIGIPYMVQYTIYHTGTVCTVTYQYMVYHIPYTGMVLYMVYHIWVYHLGILVSYRILDICTMDIVLYGN